MKLTSFATNKRQLNAKECKNVCTYLDEKFKEIEKEIGLKLYIGNIVFSSTQFHTKLTVIIPDGKKETAVSAKELEARSNLARHGWKFNLKESDLGRELKVKNEIYTIVGCSNRYCGKPIIMKDSKDNYYNISLNYYNQYVCK